MTNTIITALVGVICTILSGWGTFLFTRRKYETEVDSNEVDNVKKSFDTYVKVTEETIHSLNNKVERLQRENDELRKEVFNLRKQMFQWMTSNNYGSVTIDKHINEPLSKEDINTLSK